MGMADDELVNALMRVPPAQSLEGAKERANPEGWWGPKTATDDNRYYIPERLIGEWPYRYQGVGLHGLAALLPPYGPANLANALYVADSFVRGRTGPVKRVEDQLPMPQYPPTLAGYLQKYQPK